MRMLLDRPDQILGFMNKLMIEVLGTSSCTVFSIASPPKNKRQDQCGNASIQDWYIFRTFCANRLYKMRTGV